MIKFFKATLLFCAVAATGVSHAITMLDLNSGTARFGSGFSSADYGKPFSEQYGFSLNGSSKVDGGLISVISDARLGLAINDLTVAGAGQTWHGMRFAGDPDVWTFDVARVPMGSYVLTILGNVTGTLGGSFAGTINVASAVPEVNGRLLMLSGLGVVAWLAMRRRAKNEALAAAR